MDDRTGVVFEISKDRLVPRFILADGNGQVSKGKVNKGSFQRNLKEEPKLPTRHAAHLQRLLYRLKS